MKHICIFASGSGTNAEKIIEHFKDSKLAQVSLIISNKADAGVMKVAGKYDLDTRLIERNLFYNTKNILQVLKKEKIDLIVLAGFMWLVPAYLVKAYPNKIINIHPALLPKHGGKGMYGMHVHEALIKNKEKQSGITIHYVNEKYDEGNIIFQVKCAVASNDTPESLAYKIHELEHENYAKVVEKILSTKYE